jgi:endonuclease/exonuclease/phosphatase family metal-dependent hydrolase
MNRLRILCVMAYVCGVLYACSSISLIADTNGQTDTLRIMDYNILDYPGSDYATRDPWFRKVMQSAMPDVLVVEEMTSQTGVNTFLNDVLNYSNPGLYSTIPFHDGPDTDPQIFFKTAKVTFLNANYIPTDLRDIGEYIIRVNASSDTLHLFSVHLKAEQGSTYEAARLTEATTLRNYLSGLPAGTKFMVMGDFNFYTSSETGFQKLTDSEANNSGRLKDPINQVGAWHDNAAYALYHTQSPRTRSFGGGSTGGMDDRFDFILTSYSSLDNNTIPSSYKAYGNDGNHLNDSINRLPNAAVPDSVANALAYSTDHIPVICDFKFQSGSSPGSFVQISPANGASNQAVSGTLTWATSTGATGYDVYLDGNNPPVTLLSSNQAGTSYTYSALSNNTTYYWKVVAKNAGGSTTATGAPWSFATVPAAPNAFNLSTPSNGTTNQAVGGTLTWATSTGATGYDVYLDGNNPPVTVVSSNQAGTSYGYSGLANGITYYWKVVAKNAGGSTTATGAPWNFTTIPPPPGAFSGVSPANGASNQPASGSLRWQTSVGATSYDVYLGTTNPPVTKVSSDQTDTTYSFAGLAGGTIYYWKVTAKNGTGSTDAIGSPWNFTTIVGAPGEFSLSSPSNGTLNQPLSGSLTWQSSANATGYDVYLGNTNPPSTIVSSNQPGTSYSYSGLLTATIYYWKIVARNTVDTMIATGAPWNFITVPPLPSTFQLLLPADGASEQSTTGTLKWSSSANAIGYDIYLDTSTLPLTRQDSNLTDTSYVYTGATPGNTYYWKVEAKNSTGTIVAVNAPRSFTVANVPAAPSNFSASGITTTSIHLSWDGVAGGTGYRIYRSIGGPFNQVGNDLSSGTNSFIDTGLQVNQMYVYRVTAFNLLGEGNYRELTIGTLSATPGVPALSGIGYTSLRLTLDPGGNPSGTEFAIEAVDDSTKWFVQQNGTLDISPAWQTFGQWGGSSGTNVSQLKTCRSYGFAAKARNVDTIETSYGGKFTETLGCFTITSVMEDGWNLVSLPVMLVGTPIVEVYPASISEAYTFQSEYIVTDSMHHGVGYWLRFRGADSSVFADEPILDDTIPVRAGWNMIGSISSPVPVNTIFSNPSGLVTSRFFGYSNGYLIADTIMPGRGYWVKSDTDGVLILSSHLSANSAIHIRVVPTGELPPSPPSGQAQPGFLVPKVYTLEQAYPNPFNPSTTIRFQLPSDSRVTLKVYNLLGQVVATLVNKMERSGYKQVEWNASSFSSGIYFYHLEATSVANPGNSFTQVKKIVLLK